MDWPIRNISEYFRPERVSHHYQSEIYRTQTGILPGSYQYIPPLLQAYLSTFRHLYMETWIAHGTLLGWWWNGQILAWDWDADVQVSGQTLSYLGRSFNYTTHNYESGHVERQYLLDVSTYYAERTRGDGVGILLMRD